MKIFINFKRWFDKKFEWIFMNGRKYQEKQELLAKRTPIDLDDLDLILKILEDAKSHDLEAEVIMWAIKSMKEDNSISISEAIVRGYHEWIK